METRLILTSSKHMSLKCSQNPTKTNKSKKIDNIILLYKHHANCYYVDNTVG